MRGVFDRSVAGPAATRQLFRIRQGQRPVSDYAIEFRTLAASAGWGERELHGAYFNGLSDRLLDELNNCDLPTSLDGLVELTLHVDARLADRRASRRLRDPDRSRERSCARSSAPPRATEAPDLEPMQVGRTKISGPERQRRRDHHLCLYCGEAGHVLSVCPVKGPRPSVSEGILTGVTDSSAPTASNPGVSARISWGGTQLEVPVLLDSGSDANSYALPSSDAWASPLCHSPARCTPAPSLASSWRRSGVPPCPSKSWSRETTKSRSFSS